MSLFFNCLNFEPKYKQGRNSTEFGINFYYIYCILLQTIGEPVILTIIISSKNGNGTSEDAI
jgi:hypothetical protein